jgi:hypothetical protein
MRQFNLSIGNALQVDSSMGNLLKWHIKTETEDLYIKTSTYNKYNNIWLYESFSELIASRLFKEMGVNNVTMYYPCEINLDNGIKTIGCYSHSFLKDNEKYISLAHLNKNSIISNYMMAGYNGYCQCIEEIYKTLNIEYKNELDKILELDYITMNEDRHTGNLGFIVDMTTNKWRLANIFDNGNSLFSLKDVSEFNYSHQLDEYVKSKPFYWQHSQQLGMINNKLNFNYNIQSTLDYLDSLVKFGLDKHRISFIKQLIITRIKDIEIKNK